MFKTEKEHNDLGESYALQGLKHATEKFNISLNFSEASIVEVNKILSSIHKFIDKNLLTKEEILLNAKLYGSYMGEVYRKTRGGEWGCHKDRSILILGVQSNVTEKIFWPWHICHKKILDNSWGNIQ